VALWHAFSVQDRLKTGALGLRSVAAFSRTRPLPSDTAVQPTIVIRSAALPFPVLVLLLLVLVLVIAIVRLVSCEVGAGSWGLGAGICRGSRVLPNAAGSVKHHCATDHCCPIRRLVVPVLALLLLVLVFVLVLVIERLVSRDVGAGIWELGVGGWGGGKRQASFLPGNPDNPASSGRPISRVALAAVEVG